MASLLDVVRDQNELMLPLLVAIPELVSQRELAASLRLAVRNGYARGVDILIRASTSPQILDSTDESLLKLAADAGHVEIIHHLVKAGCDVNRRSGTSRATPLHFAARADHDVCVAALLAENADMNLQDDAGNTPLIAASKNCRSTLSTMKLLICAGCNLDIRNQDGRTALHYTCTTAIGVEMLLVAGADPNIPDNDGNTPLILAAVEGFDKVIEILVAYNCDCNIANNFQKTALHFLSMKNHHESIEHIAHAGGDVNMADGDSHIPLWFAVNYNRPEAVKALLKANCITSGPSTAGGIPLKTALEKRLFGIAKLLVLAGCELAPLYDWHRRVQSENVEQPRHFLFAADDINDDDDDSADDDLNEALSWFQDWMHTPHTLQQLCRIYIRCYIGLGLLKKGEALPLPSYLRDYITLKDVEDHHIEGFLM